MNLKPVYIFSNRCGGILFSALLLSGTVFLSDVAQADHLSDESVETVDIPTVIKPPKEDDFPKIELLSYKISSGGVTVALRATNESSYRATLGLCEVVSYKGDESSDRTFVDFYNQLGPGFNMVGSADFYISKNGRATWDKSVDIGNIERVEIDCDWTMRSEEPSELVTFSFLNYRQDNKGNIYAYVRVENKSEIALRSYGCTHIGIKSKEVLVSGLESFVRTLGPGQQKKYL